MKLSNLINYLIFSLSFEGRNYTTYIQTAHYMQENHNVNWDEYNSLYPYLLEAKSVLIRADLEQRKRELEAQARGSGY